MAACGQYRRARMPVSMSAIEERSGHAVDTGACRLMTLLGHERTDFAAMHGMEL
jgi:hypothetical protein